VNLSIDWTTWLLFYAGFYLMQILLAFYTLGSFRFEVLMLAAVSFPIYVQALFNAFVGKEQKWHVTGSKTRPESPFNFIIPQVLTFVFLALTSVVAIWRDIDNSQLTLATGWNVTNTLILAVFMVVALRESARNKRAYRADKLRTTPPVEQVATEPAHSARPPQISTPEGWTWTPTPSDHDELVLARRAKKEVVA
jgi:cellulose synthase (UDP-forming)